MFSARAFVLLSLSDPPLALALSQINEYRAAHKMDTDGSGEVRAVCARARPRPRARARSLSVSSPSQIDAEELMEIFKELGMNPSREDVDKMIADVDADGSGEIGFTEFLTMMQSQSSTTDVVKKILGTFDRLDLDPHSILTRLEMSQIIQTMAEKLTDKETNALIDELEVNEDGDVTFDQLIYHMFSDKDQASNF